MNCIYCGNKKLYTLNTKQLKCSACKRKFSLEKYEKDLMIIDCFTNGLSANRCAKELSLSYISVKKRYELFRSLIVNFLEQEYQNKTALEYDEYYYLPKSKKKIKNNIFDMQNFITFSYEGKVYNILMPELNRYKNQFLEDTLEDVYFKEFSKFMMLNKISKTKNIKNDITIFWEFFELQILKYKGVDYNNFFSYLKEIEFKFNYQMVEQKRILKELYIF